jgi:hypothetical protein
LIAVVDPRVAQALVDLLERVALWKSAQRTRDGLWRQRAISLALLYERPHDVERGVPWAMAFVARTPVRETGLDPRAGRGAVAIIGALGATPGIGRFNSGVRRGSGRRVRR